MNVSPAATATTADHPIGRSPGISTEVSLGFHGLWAAADCAADVTGFKCTAEAEAVYANHIDHGPNCLLWLAALAYETCELQDE
ncbi:hypothetical protein [Nocardia panacis]|uniref:hypothetical protein n=1 Tax=Nocardia panacis TaxID=2340916 RepID=UPI0011C343AA|nr:hypothetical protein [Nocardia panacis]